MSVSIHLDGADHLIAKLDSMLDVEAALNECGNIMEATAKELCPVDSGQLMRSIRKQPVVVEGDQAYVEVSTNTSYAPYVEYGTGIFNSGDGLYWVFVKGTPSQGNTSHKRYTLEQAKQIVAMMRAEGLDAYYTNGMPPQPFMHPALERNARQFGQIFDYYARRALSND